MKKIFAKTLENIALVNPELFLITADLGYGILTDYAKNLPKQFLNIGISEQNMIGVATGLAINGRIVFVYSIANFPTLRCLEQIRNDACYHDANVKIISVGAGFSYGAAGISHHATEDLAIMRSLPIIVIAPGDLWEVEQSVYAISKMQGVCYLRLDNSYANTKVIEGEKFTLGKARRIIDGNDCTIITTGGVLGLALQARDKLANENINCRVVSMHTINPLDHDEIYMAAKDTGGIITVEEHKVQGGLGGAVAESCLEGGYVPRFFYRIGLRAEFSSVIGDQSYLRNYYDISESAILAAVKKHI